VDPQLVRTAIVRGHGATIDSIGRYLPSNYAAVGLTADDAVIVQGHDHAGWTLDDYVIPRLASGLYFAEETNSYHDYVRACEAEELTPHDRYAWAVHGMPAGPLG